MVDPKAPALALYLQRLLSERPLGELWHGIAQARLSCTVYQFQDLPGRTLRGQSWPPWCYIPDVVIKNLLAYDPRFKDHPYLRGLWETYDADRIVPGQSTTAELRAAMLSRWRLGKGVYRVHPRMMQALQDTELDDSIPVDCMLALPEWAVLVETPGFAFRGTPIEGFVAWLNSDWPHGRTPQLCLGLFAGADEDGGHRLTWWRSVVLSAPTLGECREASLRRGAEVLARAEDFEWHAVLPFLAVLLYLCSGNREIHDPQGRAFQPPPPREGEIGKGKRRQVKAFAAEAISSWQVAWRIGAALDLAAREPPGEKADSGPPGAPTGRTQKPHIRRAHWHLFWTGKDRAEPRVHWLPPIPVNVTAAEPSVTVRLVKDNPDR